MTKRKKDNPISKSISYLRQLIGTQADGLLDVDLISIDGEISLIRNRVSDTSYFLPYATKQQFHPHQQFILLHGFDAHLTKKYSHPECKVEPGEVVVDCGGFVGGFSIAAAKMGAKKVFHVEPTPKSRRCALLNFQMKSIENIESFEMALGETPGVALLNLSDSGADNSLLEPDDGATGQQIEVKVMTIDALAQRENLDAENCFFKVEAEGFEVEIISGMNAFLPKKIVVDTSPERGGKSPAKEIKGILKQKGYSEIYQTRKCLFAVK